MNQKEVGELRRRFRPEKSAVSRIYGCYVNGNRKVVSYLDEPVSLLPVEEEEKYLGLLKKTLSGTLGKNLIDIVFTPEQVTEGEEYRLLAQLRNSALKEKEPRDAFYQKIIDSLDLGDQGYLILLVHDSYDVPRRGTDGQVNGSDQVFSYLLCCLCPIKVGKVELGYFPGDNEFHCAAGQTVAAPELGFLFPAFDAGCANISNALFYARKPDQIHQELIDALFSTEVPLSAAEQKEAFQSALREGLEDGCTMEVVCNLHDFLQEKAKQHKESKDPEPLVLTAKEVAGVLKNAGATEDQAAAFTAACDLAFGPGAALNPLNLADGKRLEIKTADAAVNLESDRAFVVETRVIDGKKYLLIPAGEDVEVNGFGVKIRETKPEEAEETEEPTTPEA
jgi:hypothetical protein